MRVFLVALIICAFASGAKASYLISPMGEGAQYPTYRHYSTYTYRHYPTYHSYGRAMRGLRPVRHFVQHGSHAAMTSEIVAHPAGCPRNLFCGCGVSVRVFGHSVRELWLVRNWYRYPRAAAAPGNVAILGSRHVAYILQVYGDGTARLYDPNSGGGLTRIRRVSLRGWAIVDPHASVRRRYQYAGV